MTTTATPATVASRMGMLGGVPRPRTDSPGARLHTDRELDPTTQRIVMAAEAGEATAQALCATAWAARADMVQEVAGMRDALFLAHQQIEAYEAERVSARGVLDVVARDVHRGTASGDLWGAYTTYTEGGAR
jgi:hypothetical protein